MEEVDYFHGCSYRTGTPQFSVEKQGMARGDQFVVDDLLDLSNEEKGDDGMNDREYGGSETITEFSSTASSTVTTVDSSSNYVIGGGPDGHFSGELNYRGIGDSGLSSNLCDPYDEIAELEWLSNFVEDSFSSEDLQKTQIICAPKSASSSVSQAPLSRPEAAPVPGKARSKRSRATACNWSSRLLLLSSLPMNSSSDPNGEDMKSTAVKKSVKGTSSATTGGRKCAHCATDKTPQWRVGPMGPKTLCNACGVRYKSGRLVPEYRPASSPTFIVSKHSNSHRKVLELRQQKETENPQFAAVDPAAPAAASPAAAFARESYVAQHHPQHLI